MRHRALTIRRKQMDANIANIEAAKKRLAALKAEAQAIFKRMQRDAANLAAIEPQIAALEPLAAAPVEPAV